MARKVKPGSKIPNSKRGRLIIRNLSFAVSKMYCMPMFAFLKLIPSVLQHLHQLNVERFFGTSTGN